MEGNNSDQRWTDNVASLKSSLDKNGLFGTSSDLLTFYDQFRAVENLHPDTYLKVIELMNSLFLSPLKKVQETSRDISIICLKNLRGISPELPQKYFPVTSIPVVCIPTKDLVKFYTKRYKENNMNIFLKCAICLFSSNVFDQEGAALYSEILKFFDGKFNEWSEKIAKPMRNLNLFKLSEGQLFQSLVKFFIPQTVEMFPDEFYMFMDNPEFSSSLKLTTIIVLRRRAFSNQNIYFSEKTVDVMKENISLVLEAISIGQIKSSAEFTILIDDIQLMKYYLIHLTDETITYDTYIKKIVERLFLAGHNNVLNEYALNKLKYEINCLYVIVKNLMAGGNELAPIFLKAMWDSATSASTELNFQSSHSYGVEKNNFYLYLLETEWWFQNMTSEFGFYLFDVFKKYPSRSLCRLLIERYSGLYDQVKLPDIVDVFEEYVTKANIDSIQEFQVTVKLLVHHLSADNILITELCNTMEQEVIARLHTELDQKCLMRATLLINLIKEVLHHQRFASQKVLCSSVAVISFIIEKHLYTDLNVLDRKIFECIMVDTFSLLHCFKSAEEIEILTVEVYTTQIYCQFRRGSVAVSKAFGVLVNKLSPSNGLKKMLIEETLSLLKQNTGMSTMLRKNPQTRLILHALCTPQNGDTIHLDMVINGLLQIITNMCTSDQTIQHAFNTLELIMDDSALHIYTHQYIGDTFGLCLQFYGSHFSIRGTVLQLYNVLLKRIFGAKSCFGRRHSLADVFYVYKNVFRILQHTKSQDLVMHFFGENLNRYIPFKIEEYETLMYQFQRSFLSLFLSGVTTYQRNKASKAYVSCVREDNIPEELEKLITVFNQSQKYAYRINEFLTIIEAMLERYLNFVSDTLSEESVRIINLIYNFVTSCKTLNCPCKTCLLYYFSNASKYSCKKSPKPDLTLQIDLVKSQNIKSLCIEMISKSVTECVELPNESNILQMLMKYILVNKTLDTKLLYKCLEIIVIGIPVIKTIHFDFVIQKLLADDHQVNSVKNIIVATIYHSLNEINMDTFSYLLSHTFKLITHGAPDQIKIALLCLFRCCVCEDQYVGVFAFLFFIGLYFDESDEMCLVAFHLFTYIFSQKVIKRKQALYILTDYPVLCKYISKAKYISYLTLCISCCDHILVNHTLQTFHSTDSGDMFINEIKTRCKKLTIAETDDF